ncbi:MAG TPA: YfhO family protein [Lachnospiraceae bacterium]|nr:YfhO family protein [Lachnospiraceae bacterium]
MDAVTILMGVNTVKTQTFQNAYFYQDNPELLQAAYDCLKDAQMQITAMEDDEIVANVTATQQKPLLFTSIPYEQGWHVYVDGSEVQIQPTIQQAFISVMLSPGAHEVRFVFKTPGAMGGWCLTLVGLISLGICIGIDLGGKKNGKNQGIL